MSKVERFEDLKVWQLARELCKEVHKLTMKEFDVVYEKSLKCSKMLKGFIIYLKDSELKGNKYK